MLLLLLPMLWQDTLRLDASTALARALERAPRVAAADARVRAQQAIGRSAGRIPNPQLEFLGENLGMQRATTGESGLRGTEGQITLQGLLPLGGDLGAFRREATAQLALATSEAAIVGEGFRADFLVAVALHERGHHLATEAAAEAAAMATFAEAMTARAAAGRSSEGEAARARTEAVMVASQVARRRAELSASDAVLSAALGLAPGTPIRISMPTACAPPTAGPSLAVQRAEAQTTLAEALADQASAARVPDLIPQIGFRRTGGFSGLLIGLAVELPLFSSGSAALRAARAELESAQAESAATAQEREAALAGGLQVLRALDAVAPRYTIEWERDLTLAISAAEARWSEGQGTLAELFDARRARLLALDEHALWQMRRTAARVDLARASGDLLTTSLLIDDCPGVPQ